MRKQFEKFAFIQKSCTIKRHVGFGEVVLILGRGYYHQPHLRSRIITHG